MSDGWHSDPYGRFELRYFDGTRWTEHVSTGAKVTVDHVAADGPSDQIERWWQTKRSVATYLGSHPSRPDRIEELGVGFLSLGFVAIGHRSTDPLFTIAWADIVSVTVETADSIKSRVTATRVLLFGAIGMLAKKTTHTAFMTVTDRTGEWVFAINGQDAAGLWAEMLPVKARVPDRLHFGAPAVAPTATPQSSSAGTWAAPAPTARERLQTLDALRAEGLISDDEWSERRAEILSSI